MTRRDARQQQQMNRLQHYRWPGDERHEISWKFAVFIAAVCVIVFVGQFG